MQSRQPRRFAVSLALVVASLGLAAAQDITLPNRPDTVKFAVIGDSGTGTSSQYKVAQQLWASHAKYPYEFVVMLGDNLYGGNTAKDYQKKFEEPYKPILDAKIKFYAAIGNHDNSNQTLYKPFNMNGNRYYTFSPKAGVRFFALDSNYMDKPQLQWLEKELAASGADWKIAFFHHPIYSSGGRHGSDLQLRTLLEPLFLKYGVDVVLAGHEHFYERIKPQKGIYYFISGGAAKLREGDVRPRSELTVKGFDTGYHFMLMELEKDALHFQVISDQSKTVDSGTLTRFNDQDRKKLAETVIGPARAR